MDKIFVVVLLFHLASSQTTGTQCKLKNGLSGFCTRTFKCPSTVADWDQGILPEMCEFTGSKPVVCCPFEQKSKFWKSELKCLKYANYMKRSRFTRSIIGGNTATLMEFTHIAALGCIDGHAIKWICSGTLISEQYVLTAAHCLQSRIYGYVQFVRLGHLDLDTEDDPAKPKTFLVSARIGHPGYRARMKYNDIGLIKLQKKVQFSLNIFPACLYANIEIPHNTLTAVGWGAYKSNNSVLMKVELDIFTDETCRGTYKPQRAVTWGILSERQFCAGGKNESRDTCQGDSGGPLLASTGHHPMLHSIVGITSFGRSCGVIDLPGVYTKVSYYLPWIESVVWSS